MDFKSSIESNCIIEEVDTFIFSMPKDYALGHCVAKDMRMSAGIAPQFKLLIIFYNYKMSTMIIFFIPNNIFQIYFWKSW